MTTPLLDTISLPEDLRKLSETTLRELSDELRAELIRAVSETGGHLGAGLGVVELTVALHYVFNTPEDKLIWDVGHQSYPHKILTGRRDSMASLRQWNGLSGFCKREESPYDCFGAGHSSTSISAALGMAVARDLQGNDNDIIAIIGDGAMSAGMAFEALNNAGSLGKRLIVILNDNDMSIAPPTGAMSAYLARLISSHPYHKLRDIGKMMAKKFPEPLMRLARKAEHLARDIAVGGTLFEQLGFYYVGPVDGHNLDHLLPLLKNVRDQKNSGPILIHAITHKGHGYEPAESSDDKYHGVSKFDIRTGKQSKKAAIHPTYTKIFARSLITEAESDAKVVAINAAMPSGTGLDAFAAAHPDRYFDVGIAEQHAVTFAAGLAAEGLKPFCAIYSTFLQRAYDQVVHDVAIQKLPVRFAIDRAGLVGADGPTHAGAFDITYLASLPGMIVAAPSDEAELMHMVATATACDDAPFAFRYPRGEGTGVSLPERGTVLEIGKGRILCEGNDAAILCLGTQLAECIKAADVLAQQNISVTVADARFAKPIDTELLSALLQQHPLLVTVEENAIGGFAAQIFHKAAEFPHRCRIIPLCLPDTFIPHGSQDVQLSEAKLNAPAIVHSIVQALPERNTHSRVIHHAG